MCVAGEVGWCLQTLLSSAHVDDHVGHLTFVLGLRELRVSHCVDLSQLTDCWDVLCIVWRSKKYRHQIQTQIPRTVVDYSGL